MARFWILRPASEGVLWTKAGGTQNDKRMGSEVTMRQYYIYIMTNKRNGTLYVGVTNNLTRRVYEHKHKLVEGFTSKYGLDRMVYYEVFDDIRLAIAREKQIKGWLRVRKIALIESRNPDWNDLADYV